MKARHKNFRRQMQLAALDLMDALTEVISAQSDKDFDKAVDYTFEMFNSVADMEEDYDDGQRNPWVDYKNRVRV